MLKHIYRICLITILSCSILNLSFVYAAAAGSGESSTRTNLQVMQEMNVKLHADYELANAKAIDLRKKAADKIKASPTAEEARQMFDAAKLATDAEAHAKTLKYHTELSDKALTALKNNPKAANAPFKEDSRNSTSPNSNTSNLNSGESTTIEGHKEKTDILNSITMVAVGLVTARLYKYIPPTIDVGLAAAGGLAFIMAEMQTTEDVNDLNMVIGKSSDGKVDNAQVEALTKMKAKLEGVKEGVEKKKKLQEFAMYAFAAATAAALVEHALLTTALSNCNIALDGAIITYTSGVATAEIVPVCEAAIGQVTALMANLNKTTPMLSVPEAELVDAQQLAIKGTTATCTISEGACLPAIAAVKSYTTQGLPITIVKNDPILKNLFAPDRANYVVDNKYSHNYFDNFLNFIFPSANAGMIEILFGATGVAAGLLISTELGIKIDTFMYTPLKRSIIWGVIGILVKLAVDTSQKTIDELASRIAKIDGMIKAMGDNNGSGTEGVTTPTENKTTTGFGTSFGGRATTNFKTPDGSKLPCITPNCSTSVTDALSTSPGWSTLDPQMQQMALGIGTVANPMQGSNEMKADAISGANIGGSGELAKLAIKNAKAAINADLKKRGQPEINFDQQQKDLLKQLNDTTADSLAKSKMSPSAMMASMGLAVPTAGADKPSAAAGKSFAKGSHIAVPHGASAPTSHANFFGKDEKFNLAKGDEVKNAGTLNDKYEMDHGDINSDKNASIFNVISERYIKSAFPKLLDKNIPEEKK